MEGREAFFLDTKMMNSSMLPDFKYWLLYLLLIRNNYLLRKAELQNYNVLLLRFHILHAGLEFAKNTPNDTVLLSIC